MKLGRMIHILLKEKERIDAHKCLKEQIVNNRNEYNRKISCSFSVRKSFQFIDRVLLFYLFKEFITIY